MNTTETAIAWQVARMDEGATAQEARAALAMADDTLPDADRLAGAFAVQLWQDIGAANMALVKATNATPEFAGDTICASHNYCDANESMAAAFAEIMGRDILPDDDSGMTDADIDLWNAAWSLAKREYLTAA